MTYRVSYRINLSDGNTLPLWSVLIPTEEEAVAFILEEMDDLAEAHDRDDCGDFSSETIANIISGRYTIKEV